MSQLNLLNIRQPPKALVYIKANHQIKILFYPFKTIKFKLLIE